MKSTVIKRSIVVAGHKTSVSLEDDFWEALREIADMRRLSLSELVSAIAAYRQDGNLSSAIRLFVLSEVRDQISVPQAQGRQNGRIRGTSGQVGI